MNLVDDGGHIDGRRDADQIHFLETEQEAGKTGNDHEESANHRNIMSPEIDFGCLSQIFSENTIKILLPISAGTLRIS